VKLVATLSPFVLAAALAACSSSSPQPAGAAPADLTGTKWELVRWEDPGASSPRPIPHAETGDPLTLAFGQASGKPTLAGFSGCNTYNAPYSFTGDVLVIGSLNRTKKDCETAQRSDIEKAYLDLLDDGVHVTRGQTSRGVSELRFKAEKGPTLVFEQR
jgi:heat shock protein HslJ